MELGWTHNLVDPLVLQAEKIFSLRQARKLFLDPDLFGEPGWEILLCAFIATGQGRHLSEKALAEELKLSLPVTQKWTELLVSRGLICDEDNAVSLTADADAIMRRMLGTQIGAFLQDFSAGDGVLQFSSGHIPEGE